MNYSRPCLATRVGVSYSQLTQSHFKQRLLEEIKVQVSEREEEGSAHTRVDRGLNVSISTETAMRDLSGSRVYLGISFSLPILLSSFEMALLTLQFTRPFFIGNWWLIYAPPIHLHAPTDIAVSAWRSGYVFWIVHGWSNYHWVGLGTCTINKRAQKSSGLRNRRILLFSLLI